MGEAFAVRGKERPPTDDGSDLERDREGDRDGDLEADLDEADLAKVERWERDFPPLQAPDHGLPPTWERLELGALWGKLNDPRRRQTAASVLDVAAWLWFQVGDVQRFRSWLNQYSASECADIMQHIRNLEKRHAKNER
jgi:hypothetical protein